MADYGHNETEKILAELERKIAKTYGESSKEMQKTIDEYFAKFAERDKKQKALLEQGKITEQQYEQWRLAQIGRGKRFEALRDQLAERATNTNEVAIAYVNDATPSVYSLNRNYAAYTIEQMEGNVGFTLWDEQTVKRLIVEEPDLMPNYPKEKAVKRGIDLEYGKKQITASVTSGILQGNSIGKIATDLNDRITDMSMTSAVRAARTAVTGAQNAGRQDSYVAAEKMGIKVRKRWVATKDGRTRHSHAMLDGQTVDADEPFVSALGSRMMFPADARGAVAADLYNCRCTMITVEKEGIEAEPRQMRVRNPETGQNELVSEMTYEEWAGWKKRQTGGKRYIAVDPDNPKDVAAAQAYRKISRNSQDVEKIAQNTGFSKEEVQQIKRHIFFEKHEKYEGYELFDPDYDMAVAWNRLSSGRHLPRDITLLRHELLESQLEKEYNIPVGEAHDRANLVYDWETLLKQEAGEGGEKYGLL